MQKGGVALTFLCGMLVLWNVLVEGNAKRCDRPNESLLIGRAPQVYFCGPTDIHRMLAGRKGSEVTHA